MTNKKRLIEILADCNCNAEYCKDCEFANDIDKCVRRQEEIIADHLIANGVTIPVRCKECKWWRDWDCTNKNGAGGLIVNGDWFCCAGERKDNGKE